MRKLDRIASEEFFVVVVVSLGVTFETPVLAPAGAVTVVVVTFKVPVFAPAGNDPGDAVTVTVVPLGGIVPDDGVTVR